MKNLEKKETNLKQLIEKLGKLNTSYGHTEFNMKTKEKSSFKMLMRIAFSNFIST